MKLRWLITVCVAGLAVSGVLIHRHYRRTSVFPARQSGGLKPLADWQGGIRLGPPQSYRYDQQLLKKLGREEKRQKPQEGRN